MGKIKTIRITNEAYGLLLKMKADLLLEKKEDLNLSELSERIIRSYRSK